MGGKNSSETLEDIDVGEISEQFGFTDQQVQELIIEFRAESKGKFEVNSKQFALILARVRVKYPDLVLIDEEVADLLFSFVDVDHDGKGDPLELIAALSVFSKGDSEDKARLVFRTLDRNNDSHLSKDEIKRHTTKISLFSAKVVKMKMVKDMKEQGMGMMGKLAGAAIEKGLSQATAQLGQDVVREIFTFNEAKDGKLTLDEWLKATQESNTGKALIHPNHAGRVWEFVYPSDGGEVDEARLEEVQQHPKGFAHLFDLQEMNDPQEVPTKISLKGTKGGENVTQNFEFATRTVQVSELLDAAVQVSDIERDSFLISHDDGRDDPVLHWAEEKDSVKLTAGAELVVCDKKTYAGELIVVTLTGKKIPIKIAYATTVLQAKEALQDKEGMPTNQMQLLFGKTERELGNDEVLGEARVFAGEQCLLHLRLRVALRMS